MDEIKVSQVVVAPDGKRVCIIDADDMATLLRQANYELDCGNLSVDGLLTYRKRLRKN